MSFNLTHRRLTETSVGSGPKTCEEGGGGLVLPSWHEYTDSKSKVTLYGIGLCYCFLGVSIVADMFMAAIERITSKKNVIKYKSGRIVTVQVWNDSVANLTLMALGSSAPEILLSLNDIFKNEFFESDIGPSTIVGSAAFNLFVIIAVCINSIPDGETRYIKEMGVFAITAVFSILAYLWLLFIVQFNSQGIIEPSEGVATFMFFPLLVITSYAADVGWFRRVLGLRMLSSAEEEDDDAEVAEGDEEIPRTSTCSNMLQCCAKWCCFCCSCWRRRRQGKEQDEDDESRAISRTGTNDLEASVNEVDHTLPIMDDQGEPLVNDCGIICFASDQMEVVGTEEAKEVTVQVYRKNGTTGRVSVSYSMERLSATPGYDYVDDSGELHFRDGIDSSEITVTILPKQVGEKDDRFQVILSECTGGLVCNPYSDGGKDKCILTITIRNGVTGRLGLKQRLYRVADNVVNMDEFLLASSEWYEQICEATFVNGSREEQEKANFLDWLSHCINFPWKFPFAVTTPPPTYLGGWICFFVSLAHIGWITVIIGDMAELFGCVADIPDATTAITFVALGTSVPDLLASRIAAKAEDYADASIVNVTGSNSVNVFLGIGLPWMVASIYWKVTPPNEKWIARYRDKYDAGIRAFIVSSGDLAFSVAVFALTAVVCLTVILIRRYKFGGELGGPTDMKAYSSFMLILLWAIYIALTIWKHGAGDVGIWSQIAMVGMAIPAFILVMVAFALCRRALQIWKKHSGEEGFWGIFVAGFVIGGRLLVYAIFQMGTS
jgi:solute carrier family 8 (sodium/calcium exchanger)